VPLRADGRQLLNCHLLQNGTPVQTLRVGLLQAMTVDPSPFAGFARIPEHTQDGATRHPSVSVLSQRGVKPADAGGSRKRIQAQGPDALGVVAVDRVAHRSVAVESIVADRGSATDPKDQISDGVRVAVSAAPADGGAILGDHPDHALLSPCLTDAVCLLNGRCPIATVGIEGTPGGRLDGEGHCVSFELKSL